MHWGLRSLLYKARPANGVARVLAGASLATSPAILTEHARRASSGPLLCMEASDSYSGEGLPAASIPVTRTFKLPDQGFFPSWPLASAIVAQRVALEHWRQGRGFRAYVIAHTTPAVSDIGGASVCIRVDPASEGAASGNAHSDGASASAFLRQFSTDGGGYVLALRAPGTSAFLPAICGAPGKHGLDRHGGSRVGAAECMVMARPTDEGRITFLHEAVLGKWLPLGSEVEVVLLARVTDFFLGMNAGTWLCIRIGNIERDGAAWAEGFIASSADAATFRDAASGSVDALLNDSGLTASDEEEPPPLNQAELWHYWGAGGNTGVSGQVTRPLSDEPVNGAGAMASAPVGRDECPARGAGLAAPTASQDTAGPGKSETTAENCKLAAAAASQDAAELHGNGAPSNFWGEPYAFEHGDVHVIVAQGGTMGRGSGEVDMTGDIVWPTAVAFCKYLCDHRASLMQDRRVLDLGAGTGLVGLVAAQLGARAVTLTDVDRVIPLLAHNVQLALASVTPSYSPAAAPISARSLWWGHAEEMQQLLSERGPFDTILGCEVIYQQQESVREALFSTIKHLLAPDGILVIAYQHRDGAEVTDHHFFQRLTEHDFEQMGPSLPLSEWDPYWDDMDIRWVRLYRRQCVAGKAAL